MKNYKVLQYFEEKKFNPTFNREERNISLGLQSSEGVYYQTLRLPLDCQITEEQLKNGIQLILNLKR